jgi:hypothetical protein
MKRRLRSIIKCPIHHTFDRVYPSNNMKMVFEVWTSIFSHDTMVFTRPIKRMLVLNFGWP